MKKRILSVLLSLVMVLTLTPVSAFAGTLSFDVQISKTGFDFSGANIDSVKAVCTGSSGAAVTIENGSITGGTCYNLTVSGDRITGRCESTPSNHFALVAQDKQGLYYYYSMGDVVYDSNGDTNKCTIKTVSFAKGDADDADWPNGGSWVKAKLFLNVKAGDGGTVTGKGYYNVGDFAKIEATPKDGYGFVRWSDGNTDNPRRVGMVSNGTLTAEFQKVQAEDGSGNKYATVSEALGKVTASGSTITTIGSDLTAVTDGTLKDGVTLKIGDDSFTAKGDATIDMTSTGGVTLKSGKLEVSNSEGKPSKAAELAAMINGNSTTFGSTWGKHYTVDINGTVTLNTPNGTDNVTNVIVDNAVKFSSETENSFTLEKSSSVITATIPVGVSVYNGKNDGIAGVAKTDSGQDTKISIDTTTGNQVFTLLEGACKVFGEQTVKAKLNDTTTVEVTVPDKVDAIIDLDNTPAVVKDLDEGESVTYGGVTYTAVANSEFPLNESKLTNNSEKATVSAGKAANVKLGSDTTDPEYTAPVVAVSKENKGKTTITKGEPSTVVLDSKDDAFTVNGSTYTAASAGAMFNIDDRGNVSLSGGAASVAKGGTLGVVMGDSTVSVKNPAANTNAIVVTAGSSKSSAEVKSDDSVTIGSKTYKAVNGDSKFEFDKDGNVTLASGTTQLVENQKVIGGASGKEITNTGDVVITVKADDPTGKDTVTVPATGSVTIDNVEYTAATAGAEFELDRNGVTLTSGAATISSGSAKIGDGASITGASGKPITNPAGSGADFITVVADTDSDKDTVTVLASGKVTIDGTEYENASTAEMIIEVTENNSNKLKSGAVKLDKGEKINVGDKEIENTGDETIIVKADDLEGKNSVVVPAKGSVKIGGTNGTDYEVVEAATIVIDENENKLDSGSVNLDDGESITGSSGKLITNPADSEDDKITVEANKPDEGKDTVTVPKTGGKVTIGKGNAAVGYETAADDTKIEVSSDGNKITAGSVKLDKSETINVGDIDTPVKNTGSKQIEVNADGTVTVPKGGTLDIGAAKITDVKQNTVFKIGEDGNTNVTLGDGETVTINGAVYTGAGDGGTMTIDPRTGKVIEITGSIDIKIDEDKLTKDFSYELVPGQSVTIGKYVYTAPADGELGDVTIKGRGKDDDGKVLNPAVVLKEVNGTVEVALSDNAEKKTTYTAANAKTAFAMAADDTTTTKVELLDNKATPNSALKFTDKDGHVVNGVTYQAQTVSDGATEKAVAYTVTYGKAEVETGDKDEDNKPIVETVNRNTVSVESGSKVIAKMTAKGTIYIKDGKIGDKDVADNIPFTAANNNASVLIDNTGVTGKSKISGNGSYLTEIKDANGNVTGYKVTRHSGSSITDNVVNKNEDKTTGTSATTTATVQNTTTTKADGTKTTTATVDKTTAEKIVEKAVANKSEEVVVNTGSSVTETAAGSTAEIQLPEQTVQGLSQKTEASVTIKSESAEVTLDKAAVDGLASQAGDNGYVKLVVETVKQEAQLLQVDLKLVTSKGNVTDFKGGNVSVTVKLNASLAAKPVVCVYIDDFGTYHKVSGQKNADGTYRFITGHFSSYAVMAEEDADKIIAEQTAKVEKLVSDLTLKARSAKTAKGNIKVTLTVDADAIKAIEDLGYTVKYKFYRSTKKSKGYAAKIEGTGKTYTNTAGTKGTRYYYKARVMVYDAQGELVTKTELKQCKYACRTK